MKMTTKLVSLLATCVVFAGNAHDIGKIKLEANVIHAFDKSARAVVAEIAQGKEDTVIDKINKQLEKISSSHKVDKSAEVKAFLTGAIQPYQDNITFKALSGDVEYKFKADGSAVTIKRSEITNLLGEMARLRLTSDDMKTVLEATGDDVADCAKTLEAEKKKILDGSLDLRKKIIRLIQCLADNKTLTTGYDELMTQTSAGLGKEDFLQAANKILLAAKGLSSVSGALKGLKLIATQDNASNDANALEALTPSVLQAFTTLLFLQRTEKDKKGEVKNLNEYLITRGNAKKVMKDSGYTLLLTDDISLEKSGLLALGVGTDTTIATALNLTNNAYVLPAAVLLDAEGKPVIGTPVLTAPYLEYVINNKKLVPANNIIVGNEGGVTSVLTTYGTQLALKAGIEVQSVDVAAANSSSVDGLSKIENKIVPSDRLTAGAIVAASGVDDAGTATSAGDQDNLSAYGSPDKTKTFKFDTKAATVIMNSLLASGAAYGAAKKDGDPAVNIATGPYYAARVLDVGCPAKKDDEVKCNVLDSTAAVMLMSASDSIRGSADDDVLAKVTGDVKNENVAQRIANISEVVIPGFDVEESSGSYVVTGLAASEIKNLDGLASDSKVSSTVIKGKGNLLLNAIQSIQK